MLSFTLPLSLCYSFHFLMVLLLYYQVYSIERQDKWLIENG